MDSFSRIVLDNTLELAAEVMTSQRVADDVKVIRGYMNVIALEPTNREHVQKLRQALSDLSEISNQNQQFFIVARLESISRQLDVPHVA